MGYFLLYLHKCSPFTKFKMNAYTAAPNAIVKSLFPPQWSWKLVENLQHQRHSDSSTKMCLSKPKMHILERNKTYVFQQKQKENRWRTKTKESEGDNKSQQHDTTQEKSLMKVPISPLHHDNSPQNSTQIMAHQTVLGCFQRFPPPPTVATHLFLQSPLYKTNPKNDPANSHWNRPASSSYLNYQSLKHWNPKNVPSNGPSKDYTI